MRVLVNRCTTLGQRTGVGHYTAELLRCLAEQAEPGEIGLFPTGLACWLGRGWAKVRRMLGRLAPTAKAKNQDAGQGKVHSRPSLLGRLRARAASFARGCGFAYLARRLQKTLRGFDLYHEPNHIPLPCDHLTVTTIHDLSALVHPEWHPAGRAAHYEKNFVPSLKRSQHFLTVSEFTRQELIRKLNVAPERITRVYNGIRPDLRPLPHDVTAAGLEQMKLPSGYLLYLGTIEPRKNLLVLLKAYCALPAAVRERAPLVLAGGWGWGCGDVMDYFQRVGRQQGVLHLGYVPEKLLPALYNGARALVYPSLYEGFGLPPMEMMACGGPVLCATADALVETVGSRAHLLDPHDVDGWRDAMTRIVEDEEWWQALRTGACALARAFTWERCAAETLQVYRMLTSQPVAVKSAA